MEPWRSQLEERKHIANRRDDVVSKVRPPGALKVRHDHNIAGRLHEVHARLPTKAEDGAICHTAVQVRCIGGFQQILHGFRGHTQAGSDAGWHISLWCGTEGLPQDHGLSE